MVRIRTFRCLLSATAEQAPDSPRGVSSLESGRDCSDYRPCLHADCRTCTSSPVVVLSSSNFCKKQEVNLNNVVGLVESGLLVPTSRHGLLICAHSAGTHMQVGVCAAVSIDDYNRGVIRKHEQTIVSKEDQVSCDGFFDQVLRPLTALSTSHFTIMFCFRC